MIIAIDYDGTYNSDYKMFGKIVNIMIEAGHTPIIVTMRYPSEEDNFLNNLKSNVNNGISVYYTGRIAKMDYMKKIGVIPDIWIDDNPHWILMDSK